jgi:hypothetical protein
MRKILSLAVLIFAVSVKMMSQNVFELTTNGFIDKSTEKDFIVLTFENNSVKDLLDKVQNAIKQKSTSQNLKVEKLDSTQLSVSDFISGYTKTDKLAGSAYLFDLTYKIIIEFRDGRIKINAPAFEIGSNNDSKMDIDAGHGNKVQTKNQFALTMGIIGKNDMWNSSHKKCYIFNEKGKLVEKKTKAKLEELFNNYLIIISSGINTKNEDW